jgi:hypothetical protein
LVLIDPPFGYIHDLQRGLSSPCHLAERAAAVELLDSPGILAERLTQLVTGILVPGGRPRVRRVAVPDADRAAHLAYGAEPRMRRLDDHAAGGCLGVRGAESVRAAADG